MTTEMRIRNQSQQLYIRALSTAWRNAIQVHDPSLWLLRDPEAEEKMLRDADIAHAIEFRQAAVAGRQWNLTPRVERSPRSELAVMVGTELMGGIKKLTPALHLLSRAFFHGSRFARIHGQARRMNLGDGRERTWWVPVRLEDMDKRMFRIVRDEERREEEVRAHWERWDIARQEWRTETLADAMQTIRHVYQDDQGTLGHGRALREALGWIWVSKTEVFQEAMRAVEKHAGGTIHAKVDGLRDAESGLPNSTLISEYVSTLEDMRARHILVTDKSDDIEILSANAEGWQIFDQILDRMRSSVLTLVLGANLTTSADKGGSFALAEIQENSTETRVQSDREALEETITDDLLNCLWVKNAPNLRELGISDEMPRFSITQEKKQDPQERATVAQTLNAMGVDLSSEDLYEQTGFRRPEEGEDVIAGGSSQPALPGLFGGSSMRPFSRPPKSGSSTRAIIQGTKTGNSYRPTAAKATQPKTRRLKSREEQTAGT